MRALAVAGVIAVFGAGAFAEALPEFTQGSWQFARSIDSGSGKPQMITTTRCASPSDDLRARREQAGKIGCNMSPVTKSGMTYTYSVNCVVHGEPTQSRSVLSVESARAYRVDIESKSKGQTTKETLVARRVGDC